MADAETAARQAYNEDQANLKKMRDQYHERMRGNPTPTQEENDLAKLGAPPLNKRETGAGKGTVTRAMEAARPGGSAAYATREARPRPPKE